MSHSLTHSHSHSHSLVNYRPQTGCPGSCKEKARRPRPGRATGTKPPRAASTEENKQTVRELHNDLEGEGKQENTVEGQSGRAGKYATGLDAKKAPPSQEPGSTSRKGPTSTRPSIQAEAELWALFQQSLSCWPLVLTSTRPDAFTLKRPCELSLAAAGRQTLLPTCDDAVGGTLGRH